MIPYHLHFDFERNLMDNERIYPTLECDKYIYNEDGSPNGDPSVWYKHNCEASHCSYDSYCDDVGKLFLLTEWKNKRKNEVRNLYIPGYWSYVDFSGLFLVVFSSYESFSSWFEKVAAFSNIPDIICDPCGHKYKVSSRIIISAEKID